MTTDEVLDYLKVTPRTIYRLIRSGDLPAIRIGRQWRFRQSDLDAWLERRRSNLRVTPNVDISPTASRPVPPRRGDAD